VIDPPFQDMARLQQDKRLKFTSTSDIGTQYSASTTRAASSNRATSRAAIRSRTCACAKRCTRRSTSIRSSQGPARAGDADRFVRLAPGHRLPARTRSPAALRPDDGARPAEGGGLCQRLLGHARLRQCHVSRRGVPGDHRHAGAGRHPCHLPALAKRAVLPKLTQATTASSSSAGPRPPTPGRCSIRSCAATTAPAPGSSTAAGIPTRSSIRWSIRSASNPTSPAAASGSAMRCD